MYIIYFNFKFPLLLLIIVINAKLKDFAFLISYFNSIIIEEVEQQTTNHILSLLTVGILDIEYHFEVVKFELLNFFF